MTLRVGVLALQGAFRAHQRMLESVDEVRVEEVREPGQLSSLQGLVLPGGESTAMLRLLDRDPGWWNAIRDFHSRGASIFGTCAGLILLAREVEESSQESLGLLDVTVARNAYGRQIDSFEARGHLADGGSLEMVFVRAPRITRVGPEVEVLATHDGDPVLVRQGSVLAASFHPELAEEALVHRVFLESVPSSQSAATRSAAAVEEGAKDVAGDSRVLA